MFGCDVQNVNKTVIMRVTIMSFPTKLPKFFHLLNVQSAVVVGEYMIRKKRVCGYEFIIKPNLSKKAN